MNLDINYSKLRTKQVNIFWGSVFGIFALGILAFFGLMFLFLSLIARIDNSLTFYLMIPSWIVIMLLSWFRNRNTINKGMVVNVILLILNILAWSFVASVVLKFVILRLGSTFDTKSLLFAALIPIIIIAVGACLSVFNVISFARLNYLLIALGLAVFITFIVSFFVYKAYFWLLVLEVVLLSVMTIWTFKVMSNEAQNIYFDNNETLIKKSMYYALEFLITYFNLFIIILNLMSINKK
ncbi:MAG0110 family membrane protein [Mycoplasmopsis edwardii]|uniref:Uncharacterized protein n=1 Tax=Mycoplasmopsis edwardii TaxID=53558 RepID=A0ACD4PJ76_9BACT|nr:hypothetical protein [Mycoplasmopsis edwardii]WBP84158.1 hypothetical protein Me_995_000116 [Mycoplasmopsis edwardii]